MFIKYFSLYSVNVQRESFAILTHTHTCSVYHSPKKKNDTKEEEEERGRRKEKKKEEEGGEAAMKPVLSPVKEIGEEALRAYAEEIGVRIIDVIQCVECGEWYDP